jgi:beta-glucosidase
VGPSTLTPTTPTSVFAMVCNTAGPAGAEVAQLYIGYPAAAAAPPKQLKGFEKLFLGPGECSGVGFPVAASDLWVWNVVTQQWELIAGTYSVYVGSSSRDIRLTGSFEVTA